MESWVEIVCSDDWTRTSCTHEWTSVGAANDFTNWVSQSQTICLVSDPRVGNHHVYSIKRLRGINNRDQPQFCTLRTNWIVQSDEFMIECISRHCQRLLRHCIFETMAPACKRTPMLSWSTECRSICGMISVFPNGTAAGSQLRRSSIEFNILDLIFILCGVSVSIDTQSQRIAGRNSSRPRVDSDH